MIKDRLNEAITGFSKYPSLDGITISNNLHDLKVLVLKYGDEGKDVANAIDAIIKKYHQNEKNIFTGASVAQELFAILSSMVETNQLAENMNVNFSDSDAANFENILTQINNKLDKIYEAVFRK